MDSSCIKINVWHCFICAPVVLLHITDCIKSWNPEQWNRKDIIDYFINSKQHKTKTILIGLLCICGEKFILMSFLLYMISTVFSQAINATSSGFFGNPNLFWGKLGITSNTNKSLWSLPFLLESCYSSG